MEDFPSIESLRYAPEEHRKRQAPPPRVPLPPPEDLTLREGLAVLYHLQQWEAAHLQRVEPYGPAFFYNRVESVYKGLANTAPKTALHHLDTRQCFVCGSPAVTIDHLMARHVGGPDTVTNYGLLCRNHNSSKGTKDLLSWWEDAGFAPCLLPRQVVCLYTRIQWQTLPRLQRLCPAPSALGRFVQARMGSLPSRLHSEACYGAAYATCCVEEWTQRETI